MRVSVVLVGLELKSHSFPSASISSQVYSCFPSREFRRLKGFRLDPSPTEVSPNSLLPSSKLSSDLELLITPQFHTFVFYMYRFRSTSELSLLPPP